LSRHKKRTDTKYLGNSSEERDLSAPPAMRTLWENKTMRHHDMKKSSELPTLNLTKKNEPSYIEKHINLLKSNRSSSKV
jgi:hypothetical protein